MKIGIRTPNHYNKSPGTSYNYKKASEKAINTIPLRNVIKIKLNGNIPKQKIEVIKKSPPSMGYQKTKN
jgi:hypothetical protein